MTAAAVLRRTTLLLCALAPLGCATPSENAPAPEPILLPAGNAFESWEEPLTFSRTYVVDQDHPQAADANPGSEDLPFRSIGRAAELLQPGERVVVKAGTYRERVRPARGGTDAARMISYEAAPGEEVVISGFASVGPAWQRLDPRVWTTTLDASAFPDENPFARTNLPLDRMQLLMWYALEEKDNPRLALKQGLLYQDRRRLLQVNEAADVGAASGRYWVADDGLTLHVRPHADADPNGAQMEFTTREQLFAADSRKLGYIRVKGFVVEGSAAGFPLPQVGAISPRGGHHWIIEDNTIRHCNSMALDIGGQYFDHGKLAQHGVQIVRRNTITDCGIAAIEGFGVHRTIIEDNHISDIGWHGVERIAETAGIKLHQTRDVVVHRNVFLDVVHAAPIWMDYLIENTRVSGNVIVNVLSMHGGIFMEASPGSNLVDNNLIIDVRGDEGVGIRVEDCDGDTYAHNLIAGCVNQGILLMTNEGREVDGKVVTTKRNRIVNNLFLDNREHLNFLEPENHSDHNAFGNSRDFALEGWRQHGNWDAHSVEIDIQARLDAERRTLSVELPEALPTVPGVPGAEQDLRGRRRGPAGVLPGPFAELAPGSSQVPVR